MKRTTNSTSHTRPAASTRVRRALITTALSALVPAAGVALASPATATPLHNPFGNIDYVARTGSHVTLAGWAADPDRSAAAVTVSIVEDGRTVAARVNTGRARPDVAQSRHTGPRTGFAASVTLPPGRHQLCAVVANIGAGHASNIGCRTVTIPGAASPQLNAAIARNAARYVGDRYVEGGASPRTGFDCSGLVQYVYSTAAHISLPHDAQTQANHARPLPKARALAGDLVFFHAGTTVYHVGIYAGGNMMWAAATPKDGVRYQTIWSPYVTFGTYTHA